MKKLGLIVTSILASILILSPLSVYATEIDDNVDEGIVAISDDIKIEDDIEDEDIITENEEEILDEENMDEEDGEPEVIAEPEDVFVDVIMKEEKESAIDQTELTQGWLTIYVAVKNTAYSEDTSLVFLFTNKETGEVTKKVLNSVDNFNGGTLKLPHGEYTVSLEDDYYDQFIIYNKEVNINSAEQRYEISINSLVEQDADTPIEEEKGSAFLHILKNNIFFLLILGGCGGFLLYREIQRRRED